MAGSSSPNTIGAEKFNELVADGRKLTGYFFWDTGALEQEGTVRQAGQWGWWTMNNKYWTQRTETGCAGTTMQTISRALASLPVGHHDYDSEEFRRLRKVDTNVIPQGPNIPISLTYYKNQCRYETIFNVSDGVIIVTDVETGQAPEGLLADDSSNTNVLSAILGSVFFKLHRKSVTSKEAISNFNTAKAIVADSLESGNPLPPLPPGCLGPWLATSADSTGATTMTDLEFGMCMWLNYVVMHVPQKNQAYAVINECLRQEGINDLDTLKSWTWDKDHPVYAVGHWAYYALLASSLGRHVAWFLIRYKGPKRLLGLKAVRTIHVFHADRPQAQDMSDEDAEKYHTPVLLFEITNAEDEVLSQQMKVENAWTETPDSVCHSWYREGRE